MKTRTFTPHECVHKYPPKKPPLIFNFKVAVLENTLLDPDAV